MVRVLLVEDDANQRKLYRQELTDEGYDVCAVPDGQSALTSVRERRPDVVVMDVALPGMNGLETMGRMLGLDSTLPVIFNTAYAHHRQEFLSWAADGYVIKSSDTGPLKDKIREVVKAGEGSAPLAG